MDRRFNVRIYGILIRDQHVLVTDEKIRQWDVTKFPGGGLEFGEGTIDGLMREFREELGIDIRILEHFYTTDFFVESAFDKTSQVISIYYLVDTDDHALLAQRVLASQTSGTEKFRWLCLDTLSENDFTLVIDRRVAGMLQQRES